MAFGPGLTAESMLFRLAPHERCGRPVPPQLDPELMDTEQVSFEEFQHCLRDLRRINLCTLAYRPTLTWLGRVVEADGAEESPHPGRWLRLWRHAAGDRPLGRSARIEVELTGVDLNPWSAKAAALATPPDVRIDYRTGDLFDLTPDTSCDVVISPCSPITWTIRC